MKIIEETFIKGQSRKEIVTVGKKKFTREVSLSGVDWRRYKTNHQVKRTEFEVLEKEYEILFPSGIKNTTTKIQARVAPKSKYENGRERMYLENRLVVISENGLKRLSGVKFIKEETGWGLKESKDFVDNFFARKESKKK